MNHLKNCGDGTCECYILTFNEKLKFLGFPENIKLINIKKNNNHRIWNGKNYELSAYTRYVMKCLGVP